MLPSDEALLADPDQWCKEMLQDATFRTELNKRLSNPWWRLNNLYFIRDEDGNLIKLKLRPLQIQFMQALHGRDILLKARQGGFTTIIDVFFLDRAIWNPSTHVGINAHTREDANKFFDEKIKTPYDNLPLMIRNMVGAEVAREGELKFSNDSLVRVAVSLRSGTYQCVHISEYGSLSANKPKRAKEVKTGTLNTAHKGSIVVIESTAEGAAGEYYNMVQAAREREREGRPLDWSEWKFHFSAWWQDPKYRLNPPPNWTEGHEHRKYFDGIEKAMNCHLSRAQRYWYALKSVEQGKDMKQEFPSTPEEAFLHSGRSVFDRDMLNAMRGETFSPIARYTVMPSGAMRLDPEGDLWIFEQPKTDKVYALGADVAEGLEEEDGNDASSADVIDAYGLQVAHYNGRVSPSFWGVILNAIGRYYNSAYLIVERNNHGHATLAKLTDDKIRYPNLHVEEHTGRKSKKVTKKLGWGTDSVSKSLMIDQLIEDLDDEALMVANESTIDELFTYVVEKNGSYGALPGSHDDRVVSLALANQGRRRLGIAMQRMRARQQQTNIAESLGPADSEVGY